MVLAAVLEVPEGLNKGTARREKREPLATAIMEVTLYKDFPHRLQSLHRKQGQRPGSRVLFPLPFTTATAITETSSTSPNAADAAAVERDEEQPPTTFPQKTFAAFEGMTPASRSSTRACRKAKWCATGRAARPTR
ncbi:MAG: hypothetical protein U0837_06900 [Dehalococcoidia bacterium]